MPHKYILTIIGDDRPGLVESLADVIQAHLGNWEESRLANLQGKFAGMVLTSIPDDHATDFEHRVMQLKTAGLSVRLTRVQPGRSGIYRTRSIQLVANDRPGILREISSLLARLNVNVEELTTSCEPAPMSNEVLFRAEARLSIPQQLSDEDLAAELEGLAEDLMPEFNSSD